MVRCSHCNSYRAAETPSEVQLEHMYTEDGIYHSPSETKFDVLKRKFAGVAEGLERCGVKPGRMLEVGCNAGYALEAFHELGWDITGCEQNVDTAKYASARLNARIAPSLEELQGEKFDLILLSHVLEHIVEPTGFLKLLSRRLSKAGLIYILVPNYGSLYVRYLFRNNWSGFIPLQHVWYFDPASLTKLLAACGFEPVRVNASGFIPCAGRNGAITFVKAPLAGLQRLIPLQGDELRGLFRKL